MSVSIVKYKKHYGHSDKKRQSKKKNIVVGIILILVVGVMSLSFFTGIFEFNQANLNQSIQKISNIIISEPITNDIVNGTLTYEIIPTDLIPFTEFNSDLIEEYIYQFTNNERQKRNISTLSKISIIDSIARDHSLDMSNRDYFSHDTPEGLDPTDRGTTKGYQCKKDFGSYYTTGLGENIFMYPMTLGVVIIGIIPIPIPTSLDEERIARNIVNGWMDSSGHRENILDPSYDKIGVGVSIDGYVYATQNFC